MRRALVWYLNVFFATGVMVILFLGLFLVAKQSKTAQVSSVKADMDGLKSGSKLLAILRLPVGQKTVGDVVAEGDGEIVRQKVREFYGTSKNVRVRVGDRDFGDQDLVPTSRLEVRLPTYGGGIVLVVIEADV